MDCNGCSIIPYKINTSALDTLHFFIKYTPLTQIKADIYLKNFISNKIEWVKYANVLLQYMW